MTKRILLLLAIILIAIQFIPVEKNEGEVLSTATIVTELEAPEDVVILLQNSCFDCHSNNTNYNWYNHVAPFSWWIADHIEEGKEELNFSEWSSYSAEKQEHKLEEIFKEVEEEEMPLSSYLIMHGEAKITAEELEALKKWTATIKTNGH